MFSGDELDKGQVWSMPEGLVRRIWKTAKLGEWSGWNSKWRARCCPMCGGPESYRQHEDVCPLFLGLQKLEAMFPAVTQPLPLDPIEEIEAKELERIFFGGLLKHIDNNADPDKPKPFWRE